MFSERENDLYEIRFNGVLRLLLRLNIDTKMAGVIHTTCFFLDFFY